MRRLVMSPDRRYPGTWCAVAVSHGLSLSSRRAIRPGGVLPGNEKDPPLCGRSARRESPVALVDNDGGGSHERPCVAHDSSVARPSTIWLPSLELWSPRHTKQISHSADGRVSCIVDVRRHGPVRTSDRIPQAPPYQATKLHGFTSLATASGA